MALDPKTEATRPVDFTDRLAMLGILGNNRWARDSIWPYVRDNWDDLAKKYDSGYPHPLIHPNISTPPPLSNRIFI